MQSNYSVCFVQIGSVIAYSTVLVNGNSFIIAIRRPEESIPFSSFSPGGREVNVVKPRAYPFLVIICAFDHSAWEWCLLVGKS